MEESDLTAQDIASNWFGAEQLAQVVRTDTNECIEFCHRLEGDIRTIYIDYRSKIYTMSSYVSVKKSLELLVGIFQPLEVMSSNHEQVGSLQALINQSWENIYIVHDAVQFTIMPYIS